MLSVGDIVMVRAEGSIFERGKELDCWAPEMKCFCGFVFEIERISKGEHSVPIQLKHAGGYPYTKFPEAIGGWGWNEDWLLLMQKGSSFRSIW